MARDEHGKLLVAKFAGTANRAGNVALGTFPFSEGWDENYWPPGVSTISGPVVNAILRIISAVGVEVNLNGILEWDTSISYKDAAIVRGSDGALYQAQQAIDTLSDRQVDPIRDSDGSHWKLITERYLADQAAAQAGTDAVKLMTPVRVREAITAILATTAQAEAGTDATRLMTPVRVREAITAILATAAQARTGTDATRLMTPVRVREAITAILATAAQARTGTDATRLMTPARVQDAIRANPASVSRHDSPAITLDAATGAVVDTSSTLGSGVAKEFQPLLVAARARGGYSIGDEITVGMHLADDVDVQVRKVSNTSFAVHCPSGDVRVPFPTDPNGIYLFDGASVFYLSAATGWISAVNIGALGVNTQGATYYVNGDDRRILLVDGQANLQEIRNPRIPGDIRRLGRLLNSALLATAQRADCIASHNGSVYVIGFHGGSGVGRQRYTGFRLARINPNNPSSTSGYGYLSGFMPERVPIGQWRGMTSHDGALYAVRWTQSGNIHRLYRLNTSTPSSSAAVLTLPSQGADPAVTLFSWSGTLYCWFGNGRLYSIATSPFSAALIGTFRGYKGAAAVTGFPLTYEASLGNTGDSEADFNLKIRYAA